MQHRAFPFAAVMLLLALLVPALNPVPHRRAASGGVIREARVAGLLVALTFDDGPDPVYTPRVLELLSHYRARATFFVTGTQAERYPQLLARVAAQGSQIGNHGYQHLDYSAVPKEEFLREVTRAEVAIRRATGVFPHVFRPPYGAYENHMVTLLRKRGYHFVLWTWSTNANDASEHPSADAIAEKIIRGVKPGAIILLHDHGGDRSAMVEATGRVLKELTAQGYRFVTLDTMLHAR